MTLNVGGRLFTTTRTTLTSEPDSVLARMFDPASPLPPARMIDGAFFIDANPAIFEVGQNLKVFLIILNLGCVGFPPSQMYPASSELADGSRVGPGKVDSFSLVSSEDLLSLV